MAKKPSFINTLLNLVTLVPSVFNFMNNLTALVSMEARLAGKSFAVMIALGVIFGAMLTATWLGVLAMLFLYFLTLQMNIFLALFIVLLLNILFLCVVGLFMLKEKKNLFFPTTRSQLRGLMRMGDDD